MSKDSVEYKYTFPYLYDESQHVAKSYKAMCTPEFYCFDADMKLVYHGQFDDARTAPLTCDKETRTVACCFCDKGHVIS